MRTLNRQSADILTQADINQMKILYHLGMSLNSLAYLWQVNERELESLIETRIHAGTNDNQDM